jgi:hypothetical protein
LKPIIEKTFAIISSLRLSVACLLYCAIIVIYGTFYQVDYGLFAAQERFFHSWVFFLLGFLPLPGLQTVLSLVLLNVVVAGIKRVPIRFKNIGLLFMHAGVIVLIAGAGVSSRFVRESIINIGKTQTVAESVDLNRWELSITLNGVEDDALWSSSNGCHFSSLKSGQNIVFPKVKRAIHIDRLYKNCQAQSRGQGVIDTLLPIPSSSETAVPGLALVYGENAQRSKENPEMFVYGGMGEEVKYYRMGDTIAISLFPARVKLPIKVTLVDFILEKHLGTSSAKKIQSRIHVRGDDIDREVLISMNRPFRYRSYTFYQTGFSDDNDGPRISTLTVVENPVRFLPHIASAMMMFGLLFHFGFRFVRAVAANRKRKK